MSKLDLKDKNLEPVIEKIFTEIYEDFIAVHGEKHKDRVKQLLENISEKVKKRDLYMDSLATANSQMGVVYGKSSKLSPILKHELFHVFNDSAIDSKDSLAYLPERYKDVFEKRGIITSKYESIQNERRERFKDDPEILEMVLTDYPSFREQFVLGDGEQEVEKWTEWFNTKTNIRDMNNNFWNWDNGFYTKSLSSKSFYDCYINLAEMVAKLFPKEKVLDMFMDNPSYRTEYTYKDLIEEFDEKYKGILSEEEEKEYVYPYLKVMMDTLEISDNARIDDTKARNAYQSCTNTLFKAYLQKMNSMTEFGKQDLQGIYVEIKDLQDNMMWNVDITKMRDLEYIHTLKQIQDKFKQMCLEIDSMQQDDEIVQMSDRVDYESNNHYQKVINGDNIARDIILATNDSKNEMCTINGFTTKVGENGIKGNLYESLRILFRDESFNLLFEEYQNENSSFLTDSSNGNKLVELYNKIKNANSENEFVNIYEQIYELYSKKMEESLITDENIDHELGKFSKEIIQLQQCALFDADSLIFHPKLEDIINSYNVKVQEYREFITNITESRILEEGEGSREHLWRLANMELQKLEKYVSSIENVRIEKGKDNFQRQSVSGRELGIQSLKEQEDTTEKDKVKNDISRQINRQNNKGEKND